jgi:hypothetical protein
MRARSRSTPARPYMARLRVFSLLLCPSVCPLLHGSETAFRTASRSWRLTASSRCACAGRGPCRYLPPAFWTPAPGGRPAEAWRPHLAERHRQRHRPRRRFSHRPGRRPRPPRGNPYRRRAQAPGQIGRQNCRLAARPRLRCPCRSGASGANDRPRRAPLVRPTTRARRGPRALGPARVPAVRPMTAAAGASATSP